MKRNAVFRLDKREICSIFAMINEEHNRVWKRVWALRLISKVPLRHKHKFLSKVSGKIGLSWSLLRKFLMNFEKEKLCSKNSSLLQATKDERMKDKSTYSISNSGVERAEF